MKKALFAILFLFVTINIFAQEESKDKENKSNLSATSDKLEQDLKQLGQDLAEGMTLFGNWIKGQAESVTADIVVEQIKLGVVLEKDEKNKLVKILSPDGKESIFAITEETQIKIQDTIEGIQNPFVGGKNSKYSKLKEGDWVQIAYEIKNLVKSILPESDSAEIIANKIDILR